jgi:hypothetical protein
VPVLTLATLGGGAALFKLLLSDCGCGAGFSVPATASRSSDKSGLTSGLFDAQPLRKTVSAIALMYKPWRR